MSSFRLSYYTLLNLFRRVEGVGADMEYVIQNSFSQFQHEKELPALEARLAELEAQVGELGQTSDSVVEDYRHLTEALESNDEDLAGHIRRPDRCLHYLRPGRLVRIKQGHVNWGWGVVVSALRLDKGNRQENGSGATPGGATEVSSYQMDLLLCCSGARDGQPVPGSLNDDTTTMQVVPTPLSMLRGIGTLRIFIPQDLRPPEARAAVLATLRALCQRYKSSDLPLLDPVTDMHIDDPAVADAVAERARIAARLNENVLYRAEHGMADDAAALEPLKKKAELVAEMEKVRAQMRESQLASFKEEAKNRSAVLRKLGHLTADNVVTTKVSC